MRVLVTRPAAQAAEWVRVLGAAGIDAVALPLIAILPAPSPDAVRAAWRALAGRRLAVFASPNAALGFFALRPADVAWPSGVRAAAVGPGTAEALARLGVARERIVVPDRDAPRFDSEALWARLERDDWQGGSVLLVRGDGGRDWLAAMLRGRGVQVDAVCAYRRATPAFDDRERALLAAALDAPDRHLWLFSSAEAIDRLDAAAGGVDWSRASALATHPRIAERARRQGFGTVREARPTPDAVRVCIQSFAP